MSDQEEKQNSVEQSQKEVTETNQESRTIKLTDEEAIRAYISDPQIKEDHLKIAQQLESIFGNKWFTIEMIIDKTMMKDRKHATEMMLGLQLFKLVTAADGGVNYKRQTKFKLTISVEDRLKVLQQHKDNHLKQIELIDKEIEALSLEATNDEKSEK